MTSTAGNGRRKRQNGRQPSVTVSQVDVLCERLAEGHTEAVALSHAGIPKTTLQRWKQRGSEADAHLTGWLTDQDDQWLDTHTFDDAWQAAGLTANDRRYWDLWVRLTRARDEAVQRAVDDIRRAGEPHDEQTTVVVQRDVVVKVRDSDGNETAEIQTLVETKTTTRHGVIDWNARAWWLERQRRDEFGRSQTITHDGGVPVRLDGVDIDAEIELLLSKGESSK